MKMRVKPIVVEVVEDDGLWLDKSTYTYYTKGQLESVEEPKGLDEAAYKYGRDWYRKRMGLSHKCNGCYSHIVDAFKAGAKWMAEQGETQDNIVVEISDGLLLNGYVYVSPEKFQHKDKVIVQIRKKEE